MIDESERIWEDVLIARIECFSIIRLERLKKMGGGEDVNQNSWHTGLRLELSHLLNVSLE
jgi:hypothetical protein